METELSFQSKVSPMDTVTECSVLMHARRIRSVLEQCKQTKQPIVQNILPSLMVGLLLSVVVRAEEPLQFNRDIRPILSDKCFACHGQDAKNRQADLRLDVGIEQGNTSLVAGSPEKSELWNRILSNDPEQVMPPPKSHKELTDVQKETIRKWIEQGAAYQKHWAFEPIATPGIPAHTVSSYRNPIDAFIQNRIQKTDSPLSKLDQAPEADRNTLLRRVAFALTGLPPTVQDLETYLNDTAEGAYERMVDRYLDSPSFGEEMARHWLDVARYADTHGMHLDNERQTWAYRDWVIRSFNKNLPFDQFTIEQLAGDLLPKPTEDQLVATGFNRCNVTSSEGGSIDAELYFRYAVDRTSTTMQAWLGLTGGCAVCHDHKFDPITQKEFYSMYAFFNAAADPAMDGNALLTQPTYRLELPEVQKRLNEIDTALSNKQKELDERASSVVYSDPASVDPKPVAIESESVWLDDEFPAGTMTAVGAPLQYIDASEASPVASGKKAVKRKEGGLAQDVWENATAPLLIPNNAKFFAYVWLDPNDPPKSIMLQYNRTGWQHRAVWGDYEIIPWGAANTTERVGMGGLPELGKWVRLEFPADKVGINAGDLLTGFAVTQHGGTVLWDKVGVSGLNDPANDPLQSFQAWYVSVRGKDVAGASGEVAARIKEGAEKLTPEAQTTVLRYYLQSICSSTKSQFASLHDEYKKLMDERKGTEDSQPSTFIYRDMATPRESFVMMRGAYDKPGEKVTAGVPAALPPLKKISNQSDAAAIPNRLDLAQWLVSPDQPLTARVTVNRFWQQFFGVGLVKTSYDFGSQGETPSHPELLDYLASEFRSSSWNVKGMVRLMVTSHTFRQASVVTKEHLDVDPENRFYSRGPRFRLDAEPIRDNVLFVSGLLDKTMGGKGVKTYQPPNIWEPVGFAGSNTRFYQQDSGSALYRRSIYTFYKRTAPPPFMSNFDAPNREQFCTRRERSNTPLQALQLMNDVQHIEAARALGQRLMLEGGDALESRIRFAYRTILARDPRNEEVAILTKQFQGHYARFESHPERASKLIKQGQSQPKAELNAVELASYTMLANTLLNLDETLTRN